MLHIASAVCSSMMTPQQAYGQYNDTVVTAAELYKLYWLEKFLPVGIHFQQDPAAKYEKLVATYKGYDLQIHVNAIAREGACLTVKKADGGLYYHSVKIKSESGFEKFMRKLNTGSYLCN
jgi:hypothetical protein